MADSQFDSLVILAGRDFGALKALVQIDGLLSPAYFHAQQAIEKTLKAVLSARAVNYPLTHNLMLLSEEFASSRSRLPHSRSNAQGFDTLWCSGQVQRRHRIRRYC